MNDPLWRCNNGLQLQMHSCNTIRLLYSQLEDINYIFKVRVVMRRGHFASMLAVFLSQCTTYATGMTADDKHF